MDSSQAIQNLYDQDGLLDILLGVEEYFDNMDLYAYKNWIYGEVVEGPIVSKYWVEITLKFDHQTFPDPVATQMFERQGTKIFIRPDWEIYPIAHPRGNEDMQSVLGNGSSMRKPKDERKAIILYKFQIPRRLVNPESFDEYKLMASDFNSNTMQDDVDVPEKDPQDQESMEGQDDDIQFDETQGGL
ncbi:hypothetical protein [Yersinia phage fHe-Yen9-04]|uniref:Uncharacterized protein n=2 Tax=Eneladusvirus Yen904 TaxID=2560849 RepID=A0A2C9CXP6_9CAUD|nr:virion structural protein [Yersinia phage fHe-Yen9-04]SOK58607.1 hypothetical protein [Yersinia phage fHe-Yen9-04]SOK59141.1 hypothetical protein [Yersinia phage fHe-Yen9-03]VUE36376.1 hypothetical protein [Yersinia phage fHe-Yen9-04]